MKIAAISRYCFGLLFFLIPSFQIHAAFRYVDSAATGSRNGISWANAWTSLDQITGLTPGDTVFISGGREGASKTYVQAKYWVPTNGNEGNPITYKIGQEPEHKGIAIFTITNPTNWIGGTVSNVIISGDAGDEKMHFKMGSGVTYPVNGNKFSNFRFSYVDCGSSQYGMSFNGVRGIEIDHTYFKKENGGNDNWLVFFMAGNPTWDDSKVHHNTVLLPRHASSGFGDDGIQGNPDGLSVYNNTFIGYTTNYTGGQHQDGIQWLKGSYLKVYNNTFTDIANYPIFGNAYAGDFSHFWVYNNVVQLTDPVLQASYSPQAIVIGQDGGAFSNLGRNPSFTDCIIANNTVLDYGQRKAFVLNATPAAQMINCVAVNNLSVNSGTNSFHASVSASNNVSLSSASAKTQLVNYTPLSSTNNSQITANASTLIGKGVSLTSVFSTDFNDLARPTESLWTIGAHEFNSTSTQPIIAPSKALISIVVPQ